MVLHAQARRVAQPGHRHVHPDRRRRARDDRRARRDFGERIEADYVYVDGLGVGDIDHVVLRDRKHLASDGMVVVIVAMDKQTGRVAGRPEVVSRGFVDMDESEDLIERTREHGGAVRSRAPTTSSNGAPCTRR